MHTKFVLNKVCPPFTDAFCCMCMCVLIKTNIKRLKNAYHISLPVTEHL